MSQGELAKRVGFQRTHVNALLKKSRPLSGYYLFNFIIRGIIRVSDIYDGKDASQKESDFWKTATLAERTSLLERIARIEAKGINIDNLLDAVDPPEKNKNKK